MVKTGRPCLRILVMLCIFLGFCAPVLASTEPSVWITITPSLEAPDVIVDEHGNFTVALGAEVKWTVEIRVTNPNSNAVALTDLVWSNQYEAALHIGNFYLDKGSFDIANLMTGPQVQWNIGNLEPGERAYIAFQVITRQNPAGESVYQTEGCGPWESGAVLQYSVHGRPGQSTIEYPARQRCVVADPPWITFELTTRKDWQIRRPGCLASEAVTFRIASNDVVSVTFADFGDLTYLESPTGPSIPAWFSWGNTLSEAHTRGWAPSATFNLDFSA